MNEYEASQPEPLDIDDNELCGLSPRDCFLIGAEWGDFAAALAAGDNFVRLVRRDNLSRIKRMCIRRGRTFQVTEWKAVDVDVCVPLATDNCLADFFVPISVDAAAAAKEGT